MKCEGPLVVGHYSSENKNENENKNEISRGWPSGPRRVA